MPQKYNPKRIIGSFKGKIGDRDFAVKFLAFMEGSFIEAEYDEDRVTVHVGADGVTTFVLNANSNGKCLVTFSQGSPVNQQLSNLIPSADLDFMPVGTLEFRDLNGTTVVSSAAAVISKTAKIEFSNAVTGRQWTFAMDHATLIAGIGDAT